MEKSTDGRMDALADGADEQMDSWIGDADEERMSG